MVAISDIAATKSVWVGPRQVPVWPEGLILHKFDEGVFFTINSDLDELLQPLIDAILKVESQKLDPEDRESPGQGGNRVRNLHELGVPIFDLLNERAKRLFMHVTHNETAVIDDCCQCVSRRILCLTPQPQTFPRVDRFCLG